MPRLIQSSGFEDLFLGDIPLLDVRAPVEFARGSFPGAVNLPLLNDREREKVGTEYKNNGQAAALALGHQLVSGDVKSSRVDQWSSFAKSNPGGCLFCFRGGLRSQIAQQWLQDAGIDYPRVQGGYKSLRRYLIDRLETILRERDFIVIGGYTGSGKTDILSCLDSATDLEAVAHHRGSSFGRRLAPQPSQIDFENTMTVRMMKICSRFAGPLFVEDESHLIGRCAVPPALLDKIARSQIALVEEPIGSRINRVERDYILSLLAEYQAAYGDEAIDRYAAYMLSSLARIKKRLGGERYSVIEIQMTQALQQHKNTGDATGHRIWIEQLLKDYYDPMYTYQLSNKADRIAFKGERDELMEWCRSKTIKHN